MTIVKRSIQRLTLIMFLAIISIPSLTMLTTSDKVISEFENRALAQPPEYTGGGLSREFIDKLEAYVQDHLGYREEFIYWQAYLDTFYLQQSPSEKVLIGQDGWLYYSLPYSTKDRQGLITYSQEDKKFWRNVFQLRHDWLEERGIIYVLVIAPDKKTIYPEYYPEQYPIINPDNTLLDQFLPQLRNTTNVHVIDLRVPLLDYKENSGDDRLLFYKTDTHWNSVGAYVAYKYLIDELRVYLPELPLLEEDSLIYSVADDNRHDLARMINLVDDFSELSPHYDIDPTHQCAREVAYEEALFTEIGVQMYCADNNENILVFHDSFFNLTRPFLSESFRNTVYFYPRRFMPWRAEAEMEALIESFRPTIIIEQIVERGLPRLPETRAQYEIVIEE